MVVIAFSRLRDFWTTFPDAETSLRVWYKAVRAADWANFGNANSVGNCAVFNIAGNKYRLAARVRYPIRTVFVLRIMTHDDDDDQERWQDECGCHKPPPRQSRRPKKTPPQRRT